MRAWAIIGELADVYCSQSMRGLIKAEWLILQIWQPGRPVKSAGILLLDRKSNELFFKLKADLRTGDRDVDLIWKQFPEELSRRAEEAGADEVVNWLGTTASHVFRVSDLQLLETENLAEALELLYKEYVE